VIVKKQMRDLQLAQDAAAAAAKALDELWDDRDDNHFYVEIYRCHRYLIN
jgi:hypothetical protein